VVQPRRGSFTEIVETTGGGLLVEPDSAGSLASSLLQIYREPALGDELGMMGFENVRRHYSVAVMADRALEVYEELTGRGSVRMNADQVEQPIQKTVAI
jgi:glycosyltransferase involved in cell wall biosynthesis